MSGSASLPFAATMITSHGLAVRVAHAIELLIAEDRRNGCCVDDDVLDLQRHLDTQIAATVARLVPAAEPTLEPVASDRARSVGETVNVAKAAQLLGTSERWIRKLCSDKQLAAERLSRTWTIDKESLMRYIENRAAA